MAIKVLGMCLISLHENCGLMWPFAIGLLRWHIQIDGYKMMFDGVQGGPEGLHMTCNSIVTLSLIVSVMAGCMAGCIATSGNGLGADCILQRMLGKHATPVLCGRTLARLRPQQCAHMRMWHEPSCAFCITCIMQPRIDVNTDATTAD